MIMTRKPRLTIAVLLLLTAGCSSMSPSARQAKGEREWDRMRGRVKLRLAQRHYQAGQFEDAIRAASESIALDPTQPATYVLLAQGHLECSRPASAQQVLDAAARANLESADLHYVQGVILEQQGRTSQAVAEYARARDMEAGNADYLIAQAECLVALGREDEASALLAESAGRFDDEAAVAVLAARVALLRGDAPAALENYGRALAAVGDSELIAEELGLLLAEEERCAEAIAILGPLIEPPVESHKRGTIRRALAGCHLQLGDPAAAGRALADYARANSQDALAQLLLAKAALATDDLLAALRAADLARRHRPDHPEVLLVQAAAYWRHGALEKAASLLGELLARRPEDIDARCLLGELLHAQHRPDDARVEFQKALDIDPQCPWALAGLNSLSAAAEPQQTRSPSKVSMIRTPVMPGTARTDPRQ